VGSVGDKELGGIATGVRMEDDKSLEMRRTRCSNLLPEDEILDSLSELVQNCDISVRIIIQGEHPASALFYTFDVRHVVGMKLCAAND